MVALKRADGLMMTMWCLASESVQSSALSLQSIDNIHGSDSLPLGVLSVGDSISDYILQEYFENSSGLLIDQSRDSLHSASSCQTSDSRLGDSLDVISQNLSVPLSASLAKSLASFASSRHDGCLLLWCDVQNNE